jgi:glycosyltransferase involved in cell wall biosynthesis
MKVKYYPYQPHCFAFGGFDMQMLNALDAVNKNGMYVSKLDVWSRDNDFDIIHLWGIGPSNYHIIDWARKAGKKVVATVLLPYFDTIRLKLSYYKHFLSTANKQNLHYYSLIDKIVVVNELQASVLIKYYKVDSVKIEVIPNIVEEKYFIKPNIDFSEKYGIENYVLCTGNICSRKNQYNLALACVNLSLNLVLIGKIHEGEDSYAEKLERLLKYNTNIKWIKELPKASEDLVAAYNNCTVFALPSKDETQPISALEAVAMQKPLVLMDKKYAYQSFYAGAVLCKSESAFHIEEALKNALKLEGRVIFNDDLPRCKHEIVGLKYKNIYQELFCNKTLNH